MSRGQRRTRLWLSAAAVAAYLPILGMPFRAWLDFSAFWAAGHFVFSRQLLDIVSVVRFQVERGLAPTPFVYPPGFALLYAPLAALPYDLAAVLHLTLMLAALVLAARIWADLVEIPRCWAVLGALAWGPAAASVVSGQNATLVLLIAAIVTRELVRARDRGDLPGFRVGFLAGLAMFKPQLGAPLAALVAVRSDRRALVGIGAAGLALYGSGVVAAGMDPLWPTTWLAAVSAYSTADYSANGWQAISGPSIGGHLSVVTGSVLPTMIGWAAAIAFVGWVVRGIRAMPVVSAVVVAMAAGLVINPHAWIYDATLLLPALGLLAADATRRGWPRADRLAFVVAFAIGSLWPFGAFVGSSLVPIVVVAVPIALRRMATRVPEETR